MFCFCFIHLVFCQSIKTNWKKKDFCNLLQVWLKIKTHKAKLKMMKYQEHNESDSKEETNKTFALPNFMPQILPDDEIVEGIICSNSAVLYGRLQFWEVSSHPPSLSSYLRFEGLLAWLLDIY